MDTHVSMLKRSLCIATISVLFAACGGTRGVAVTLDEYSLDVEPATAPAGSVEIEARNTGSIVHQLIVLRSDRAPDALPVKGGVAQVDAKGIEEVARIDALAATGEETLEVRLRPGSYILICNIAGHYDNGMRARLRVG